MSTVRGWLHDLVRVGPHDHAHWNAVRSVVSVVLPIAVLVAIGRNDLTVFGAFGGFAALFGRAAEYPGRFRLQVVGGAAMVLSVVAGTVVGVFAPASWYTVVLLAALSVVGFLLTRCFGLMPVPSLFMVFAGGSTAAFRHQGVDVLWALGLSVAAATVAVAIGQLGRFTRVPTTEKHPAARIVGLRVLLADPATRVDAWRYFLGPLLAGGLATAVGIGHPYWGAVAATVPLAGATFGAQLGRAVQRVVGTLLGIAILLALLATGPSVVVLVVAVAVFQAWTELFAMRNYALMMAGVTPLALIMVQLGAQTPVAALITDRAVETVIGVVVAVVVVAVLRPRPSVDRSAEARAGAVR